MIIIIIIIKMTVIMIMIIIIDLLNKGTLGLQIHKRLNECPDDRLNKSISYRPIQDLNLDKRLTD